MRTIARTLARRASVRAEVIALKARVAELEEQVAECRQHHLRLAELTDIVQELLVPLSRRDDEAVRELLERYTAHLGR